MSVSSSGVDVSADLQNTSESGKKGSLSNNPLDLSTMTINIRKNEFRMSVRRLTDRTDATPHHPTSSPEFGPQCKWVSSALVRARDSCWCMSTLHAHVDHTYLHGRLIAPSTLDKSLGTFFVFQVAEARFHI